MKLKFIHSYYPDAPAHFSENNWRLQAINFSCVEIQI